MNRRTNKRQTRPAGLKRIMIWFVRQRGLLKIYVVFVLFIVILFSFLVTDLGKEYISMPLNRQIAVISAALINVGDSDAVATGTQICSNSGAVDIKEGCNGLYATVILLAGMVAFPASWRQRAIGILLGTVALFVINLIRVITLFYLSASHPELFQEAHMFIWQFAIIIIAALLWLVWYDKIVSREAAKPAL